MKRRLTVVLLILGLLGLASPVEAHHSNTCSWSGTYASVPASVTWQGECHCNIGNGYKVAAQSKTYGFGTFDSSGTKVIRIESFGTSASKTWPNGTEFDHRGHRYVSPNYSIVQEVQWRHDYVWTGGDVQLLLYCSRQAPGSYVWTF